MRSRRVKKIVVNIARLVLAVTFILSGFVKAVDPLGTQYKITDYLEAMHLGGLLPDLAALGLSVILSAAEFCLGVFLLFAIQRRLTSRLILLMMVVMTPLTLWLALANPISDCGCFGDAVVLTNWQTFLKNVVLLACAIVVARWPQEMDSHQLLGAVHPRHCGLVPLLPAVVRLPPLPYRHQPARAMGAHYGG